MLDPNVFSFPATPYARALGNKQYEITDHLSNVRAVVYDYKEEQLNEEVQSVLASTNDYWPIAVPPTSCAPNMLCPQLVGGLVGWWGMPLKRGLSGAGLGNEEGYEYAFNGQMKSDEVYGEGMLNTAQFWEYDTRLGRRWNLDPVPQISISDYAVFGDNPIKNNDILGNKFVDYKGNEVKIKRGKDGNLEYKFNEKYSKRQERKARRIFNRVSSDILESLNESEVGYELIQEMANHETEIYLHENKMLDKNANAYLTKGKKKDEISNLFKKVSIKLMASNYSLDKDKFASMSEWILAALSIEFGHFKTKEQIIVEEVAKENDEEFEKKPNSKEFREVYEPLLNSSTCYRIRYRHEKEIDITDDAFSILKKYNLQIDYEYFK